MTFDFRAARLTMVESQVRTADVTDLAITDAMRTAPREGLCPDKAGLAYADAEIEYAPGLYLMRPREIGKLLQAVQPRPLSPRLRSTPPCGQSLSAPWSRSCVISQPEFDLGARPGLQPPVGASLGPGAVLDQSRRPRLRRLGGA